MHPTPVFVVASLLGFVGLVPLAAPPARAAEVALGLEMLGGQFNPSFFRIESGDNVTFVVWNNDSIEHSFLLEGEFGSGRWIDPDPWTSPTYNATQNGTVWFYCDVSGHATRLASGSWTGMAGQLQIGPPSEPRGTDPTLLIVGGGIVLVGALAMIAVVVRRRKKEPGG